MTTDRSHFDAGIAALEAGDVERAAGAFERALAADPADTDARYRLANAYRDLRRYEDAEREMRKVVDARPRDAKPLSALGVILTESGRPEEAVQAYETAMAVDPTYVRAASNWVNAQQYVSGASDASVAKSLARWTALYSSPVVVPPAFANPPTMDRPIVVGFVSGDLGLHPVGRLSVRLFENLQPHVIRACVFSTRPAEHEDEISRRIANVTRWASVFGLPDASLIQFIKASKVDVLIDMDGHTGASRPGVFMNRAAPVQASWLGHPGASGIPAIDYLLTTDALAPPGFEAFAHEKMLRFTTTHACFEPADAPPVAPRPSERNGYVTFGCFNNPAKISADAIASFAAIMKRLPDSRLKIHYVTLRAAGVRERLHRALESHGIARARVDLTAETSRTAFLSTYNDVDIALDSFPYSGCMTTCEALWMGCPVITFAGPLMAGRQSASILTAAGLGEFIAKDRAGYEDLAVTLAQDPRRLTLLRTGLRTALSRAPLCDGAVFARDFTAGIKTIWAEWCAQQSRRQDPPAP